MNVKGKQSMNQTTNEYRARKIYSQRLAGYLMQRGFVLARMDKDIKCPNRNVFIFKDTEQLSDAMESYSQNR